MQRMSSLYNFIQENHVLVVIETAAMRKMTELNLSHYEIGHVPTSLLLYKHLAKLYLNNNLLKALPEEISNWEHLKLLALDYNLLTKIPSSIGRLQNLVSLNLSYNNLGYLTPEIGLLSKLEVLWLNHTHLEFLPPEIGNCTELDTLGARGNFIRNLPSEIGKLHNLRWLTLEGNLLSDLPEGMSGLSQLVHLNLNNNKFDTMPELENLQELQYVLLSQNMITELDVSHMEGLSFVKRIYLRDNPISNIYACRHLKNLVLDDICTFSNIPQQDDSDSDEWEDSVPSSELDISDTSEEDIQFDVLAATLPKLAKFTATGF